MFRKGDIVRRDAGRGRLFYVQSVRDGWVELSPCRKDGRRVRTGEYGTSGPEAAFRDWVVLGHFDGDHWSN